MGILLKINEKIMFDLEYKRIGRVLTLSPAWSDGDSYNFQGFLFPWQALTLIIKS